MSKQLKLSKPIPAVVTPTLGMRVDTGQFKRFFFNPVEGQPVHWICKKCKSKRKQAPGTGKSNLESHLRTCVPNFNDLF